MSGREICDSELLGGVNLWVEFIGTLAFAKSVEVKFFSKLFLFNITSTATFS